jgi:hypothetical protein|tara:strand:- start:1784 stop:2563 length:780 start_codon:yes stop_codon:yes gene_type:complete
VANTTSGTTTFGKDFTIDEIVEESFERLGIHNVTGYQLKSSRRSLNILLQEWGNRGIHYWEIRDTNIDLVEGQDTYKLYRSSAEATAAGDQATTKNNANAAENIFSVSDILESQLRANTIGSTDQSDTPMTKIDRSTYGGLSNKKTKGTPNQYWVERFIDRTEVHVYPTPDSTNAAKHVHVYYIKRIDDVGDYTNSTDLPFRFVPCMVSGLTYYLSQKYAPQLTQGMKLLYEDELARALAEDGSASSTYITPKTYYPGT